MKVAGHPYPLLSTAETETIHRGVLRILAEAGMQIQNQALLADLAAFGLPVDFDTQRVRFPRRGSSAFWPRPNPTIGSGPSPR